MRPSFPIKEIELGKKKKSSDIINKDWILLPFSFGGSPAEMASGCTRLANLITTHLVVVCLRLININGRMYFQPPNCDHPQ